jgi:hypothetical protein
MRLLQLDAFAIAGIAPAHHLAKRP